MAVCFKNRGQILKHSLKQLSYSLRYLSSTLVQNGTDCSAIPLWSQRVNNFGHLRVFSGNLGVHVTGSNSWHGEQSTVRVLLVSDCKNYEKDLGAIREYICCDTSNKNDGLSQVMIQTDDNKILQNFKPTLLERTKLLIKMPHSYELYLNCGSSQAPVTVENLECDNIEIHTEGNCFLSKLKSQLITVNSNSGDILSKSSLVGNLELTTNKDSCVHLGKIQGNDMKINCENGDVIISSLYGGDVLVNTQHGNIKIGDAHGSIEVTSISGDIKCGSIAGMLKAITEDGNIETKLTLGGNINATGLNGNAIIKLDSDLKCKIQLSSKTMDITPDLLIHEKSERTDGDLKIFTGQTHGVGEQYATVKCQKGNIDLLQETWFVMPKS